MLLLIYARRMFSKSLYMKKRAGTANQVCPAPQCGQPELRHCPYTTGNQHTSQQPVPIHPRLIKAIKLDGLSRALRRKSSRNGILGNAETDPGVVESEDWGPPGDSLGKGYARPRKKNEFFA